MVVLDNLENSHLEVLHRVRILAAQHHTTAGLPLAHHPPLYFHSCDVQDRSALAAVFSLYATAPSTSRIVSAIHFAALKSVSGSLTDPLSYYQINVGGTLNLAGILARWNCKKLVFSSSCVVYGAEADGEGILEEQLDVRLGASKGITNPCESSHPSLGVGALARVGADERSRDDRWQDEEDVRGDPVRLVSTLLSQSQLHRLELLIVLTDLRPTQSGSPCPCGTQTPAAPTPRATLERCPPLIL